jgi:oxygen-dependent protoporphyrinogen oxidase
MKKHIIVIGGGIAGTAAAYHLKKKGYDITILEKNNRLGGRIYSTKQGEINVELGAGFLTRSYNTVLSFIKVKGLSRKLFAQHSNSGIILKNKFFSPASLFFSLTFFSKTLFIKLYLTVLLLWWRIDTKTPGQGAIFDTRSVTDIFRNIADKQILEYIFQPILNGYFFWTPEQTSQAMLLVIAKFLLRGGRYRLREGLQQIPEMAAKGCIILLGHTVTQVNLDNTGRYAIAVSQNSKTRSIHADGIVCAVTASVVPHIFPDLEAKQKQFFSSIEYSSTVVVVQTYKQQLMMKNIALAIPRNEESALATITVVSEKRAPNTFFRTIKMYLPDKKYLDTSEAVIIKMVTERITPIREVLLAHDAVLESTLVQRWKEAIPVFNKGSMNRLSIIVSEIEDLQQPLVFAGDYLEGPCIEWAFISGMQAAERLGKKLNDQ